MAFSVYRFWETFKYLCTGDGIRTAGGHETLRVLGWALVVVLLVPALQSAQSAPQPVVAQPRAPAAQLQQPATQPNESQQAEPQQRQPRIRLNTLKPIAGKNVVIVGRGLPAGSQVTARLTAPNGSVTQESTRVEDGGRFRLTLALPNEGTYTLAVRGQGLDQMRTLEVQRAEPQPVPKSNTSPNRQQRTQRPGARGDGTPAQGSQVPKTSAGSEGEK